MTDQATNQGTLKLTWMYLAWVGMAFCSLVIAIVAAILQGPPEPVAPKVGLSHFSFLALALYSLGTVLSVVILCSLLRSRGITLPSLGLRGTLAVQGILYALSGLVVGILLYTLTDAILESLGIPMFWGGPGSVTPRWSTTPDLVTLLFFAVIIGPVAEEIIFWGYVVSALKQANMRVLVVYVLSAIIFTSVHVFIGPGTLVFIFFWSFIPTFLLLKFNSLYPGILFHALNNLFAYVAAPMWFS